jgi:hypothetical protein
MGDKKVGTKQKVPLIKDTHAIIHKVASNPIPSPVTIAKQPVTMKAIMSKKSQSCVKL